MCKKVISAVLTLTMVLLMATNAYASSNVMKELAAGAGGEESSVSVYDGEGHDKAEADGSVGMKPVTKGGVSGNGEVKTAAGAGAEKSEAQTTSIDTQDDTVSQGSASSDSASTNSASAESASANNVSENKASDDTDDEFANLCITTVENSMNVRSEASEDAGVVGYLYKDCVGEIIEQKDGWTLVKSGKLEGWANNDYLLFGDKARDKIAASVMKIAVINTETLRVREAGSEDAPVTSLLALGDEVDVLSTEGEGWTKVSYEDGTEGAITGFISNEYISIKNTYKQGETIEEVKDREERAAAQKKAQAASSGSSGSKSSGGQSKAAPATTNNGAVAASVDDATLLAALIQCECNGPYEGQLAVGAVVMNRVKSGYGSISGAVYAPGQFGPASSGKLAMTLSTGAISATARQAANDAISGVSNVGSAKYFRNIRSGHEGIVIGNHVFW